jgi:hypothetical protein
MLKLMAALISVLLVALACALTGPQRALYVGLCKAQCPIAKSLALRGCAEIDEPALQDACVLEVEAVAAGCPAACEIVIPAPE